MCVVICVCDVIMWDMVSATGHLLSPDWNKKDCLFVTTDAGSTSRAAGSVAQTQ